jgi:hypothetical protein
MTGISFESITDAIAYVREALGTFADDFDCEAIARGAFDWYGGRLYLIHDGDEFWAIVARHDLTC